MLDALNQALLVYTTWYYLISRRDSDLDHAEKDVHW